MVCSSFDVVFDEDDRHESKALSLKRLNSQYVRALTARPLFLGCILMCTVIFLWRGFCAPTDAGKAGKTAEMVAPTQAPGQAARGGGDFVAVHKGKQVKKQKLEKLDRKTVKQEDKILRREKLGMDRERGIMKDEAQTLTKEEKILAKAERAFAGGDLHEVKKFEKDLNRLAKIEGRDAAKVHKLAMREHRKEARFAGVDDKWKPGDIGAKGQVKHVKDEMQEQQVATEIEDLEQRQRELESRQADFTQRRTLFEQRASGSF